MFTRVLVGLKSTHPGSSKAILALFDHFFHIQDFLDVHLPWTGHGQIELWVWSPVVLWGVVMPTSMLVQLDIHASILSYTSLGLMCHNIMFCCTVTCNLNIMLSLRGLGPWQTLRQVTISETIHSPLPGLLPYSGEVGGPQAWAHASGIVPSYSRCLA